MKNPFLVKWGGGCFPFPILARKPMGSFFVWISLSYGGQFGAM